MDGHIAGTADELPSPHLCDVYGAQQGRALLDVVVGGGGDGLR